MSTDTRYTISWVDLSEWIAVAEEMSPEVGHG